MSSAGLQIKLALWKDYLIRKRKPITIVGVLWAIATMMSVVIVRLNTFSKDVPTCQFKARALPSAGVINFLQSFICTLNNECEVLNTFEEVPRYESARLTAYERQFQPVLENSTAIEVAETLPDSMRLVALMAKTIDQPEIHEIVYHGFRLSDLFRNSEHVTSIVSMYLNTVPTEIDALLHATINFENILIALKSRENLNCSEENFYRFLNIELDNISYAVNSICKIKTDRILPLALKLLSEININKYGSLFGRVFGNLTNKEYFYDIGHMMGSTRRLTDLRNFIPDEIVKALSLFSSTFSALDSNRSGYINVGLARQLVNLLDPYFGNVDSFISLKSTVIYIVKMSQLIESIYDAKSTRYNGVQTKLNVLMNNNTWDGSEETDDTLFEDVAGKMSFLKDIVKRVFQESRIDPIDIMSEILTISAKLLPEKDYHKLTYYCTLMAKFLKAAQTTIDKNIHMEEIMYDTVSTHKEAAKLVWSLGPTFIEKVLDGLVDAKRIQVISEIVSSPVDVFCDVGKCQRIMAVSGKQAAEYKAKLCNKQFENFLAKVVESFGINQVKADILDMATLMIGETVHRDISDKLLSPKMALSEVRNFFTFLNEIIANPNVAETDWTLVIEGDNKQEIIKTAKNKMEKSGLILLTVHVALSRVVIKQNIILESLIKPHFIRATSTTKALQEYLNTIPDYVTDGLRKSFVNISEAVLATLCDKQKTINLLSVDHISLFCNRSYDCSGEYEYCSDRVDMNDYILYPTQTNVDEFNSLICNSSLQLRRLLNASSSLATEVNSILSGVKPPNVNDINWVELVRNFQNVYLYMSQKFGYIMQTDYFTDDARWVNAKVLGKKVLETWIDNADLKTTVQLGVSSLMYGLQILDYKIFNVSQRYTSWNSLKHYLTPLSALIHIGDEFLAVITGILSDMPYHMKELPVTSRAVEDISSNLGAFLKESAVIIAERKVDLPRVLEFLSRKSEWPCSVESIATVFEYSINATSTVLGGETLLCLGPSLQQEWINYESRKDVAVVFQNVNQTNAYDPHLFFKFSQNFNNLLDRFVTLDNILHRTMNGTLKDIVEAAKYAIDIVAPKNGNLSAIRYSLTNIDIILQSVDTDYENLKPVDEFNDDSSLDEISVALLWEDTLDCMKANISLMNVCKRKAWNAMKYTMLFVAVGGGEMVDKLVQYFIEVNEPNVNFLQVIGFLKDTGPYLIYDKFPNFLSVLLNSYLDYHFMYEVRGALGNNFWDCDAIMKAVLVPIGSMVTNTNITKLSQYVCPSLLYWVSGPVGENALLDVYAKPQKIFFSTPAVNLNGSLAILFDKILNLKDILDIIAAEANFNMESNRGNSNSSNSKLMIAAKTNDSFKSFTNEIIKQSSVNLYLGRIVNMLNNIVNDLSTLDNEERQIPDKDLAQMLKFIARKPDEVIKIFLYLTSETIRNGKLESLTVDSLKDLCNHINDTVELESNWIHFVNPYLERFCSLRYDMIISRTNIKNSSLELSNSVKSIIEFISMLQSTDYDVTQFDDDIIPMLKDLLRKLPGNDSTQPGEFIMKSISYSSQLGLPLYTHYLDFNIQHYDILLTFLSGGKWWPELRELYTGKYVSLIMDVAENIIDILDDIVENIYKIKLVRFFKYVNFDNKTEFCDSFVVTDYLPDSTGWLTKLKNEVCNVNLTALYIEIEPIKFAIQGHDETAFQEKYTDSGIVDKHLNRLQQKIVHLWKNGPKEPTFPDFMSYKKLLKSSFMNIMESEENVIDISFAVISNFFDLTLLSNRSKCEICSWVTAWLKQINLQFVKSDYYQALLCKMPYLQNKDIYNILKEEFHWDLSVIEILSNRNYTLTEFNKYLNLFLEAVRIHMKQALNEENKVAHCLLNITWHNDLSDIATYSVIGSKVVKFLKVLAINLSQIPGIESNAVMADLSAKVMQSMPIYKPLRSLIANQSTNSLTINMENICQVADLAININELERLQFEVVDILIGLKRNSLILSKWLSDTCLGLPVCHVINCNLLSEIITDNRTVISIKKLLPEGRHKSFWSFDWLSDMLDNVENLLFHLSQLLKFISKLRFDDINNGQVDAIVDAVILIFQNKSLSTINTNVLGLIRNLHPFLVGTPLEQDISALQRGIGALAELRNDIVGTIKLEYHVDSLFSNWTNIKDMLIDLTSLTPREIDEIRESSVDLSYLLLSEDEVIHIKDIVCDAEKLPSILKNKAMASEDMVSISNKLCQLSDYETNVVAQVFLNNVNYTDVFQTVIEQMVEAVYRAVNLTKAQGERAISSFGKVSMVAPLLRNTINNVSALVKSEPLIAVFREAKDVNTLLKQPTLMADLGNLLCGKPIAFDGGHLLQVITSGTDNLAEVNDVQLHSLPTEFCRSLYKDIIKMSGGKIIWSFMKPLLMGKILYTPPDDNVKRIMTAANFTFASVGRMTDLVKGFANGFESLHVIVEHKKSVDTMQALLRIKTVREILFNSGNDGDSTFDFENFNLTQIIEEFGDSKNMGSLLSKMSNLVSCFSMDRMVPVADERALEIMAAKLVQVNELTAGIVFANTSGDNVEYTIRMDIDNVPTTSRIKSPFWIPGPNDNFFENLRYFRGFIQLQDMLDKAIIATAAGRNKVKRETEADLSSLQEWAMYTQQMPYPCYKKDSFQTSLYESQALIAVFSFSLIMIVASCVRHVVFEKESGNTMLMSIMGMKLSYHTFSWFLVTIVETLIACTVILLILWAGNILPYSNKFLIWLILVEYGFSVVAFCYMVSQFFNSASLGSVFACILLMMSYFPYVVVVSLESNISLLSKILVSLSMSSSFSYSMLYATRWEVQAVGIQYNNIWVSPLFDDDMNVGITILVTLFDAGLYFLLGWLLNVFLYNNSVKNENIDTKLSTVQSSSMDKIGVRITNVTKAYSRTGNRALDDVSIDLYKGQITTLLGHNGAGKTTLIKMLTGLLRPTHGNIIISTTNDNGAADSQSKTKASIGLCPQNDVLIECMSSLEHLVYYARLKTGLSEEEVAQQVSSMAGALGLGYLLDEPVHSLSGGMRRRLNVGIAFLASPDLVLLDEPSTGVDPKARREIWSLIVALRGTKTVLLTTHHLDEAEILSDVVVLMHKGKVFTSGSPLALKHNHGSGYKLSINFCSPDKYIKQSKLDDGSPVSARKDSNENVKEALVAIRGIIKNATIVEYKDDSVVIQLPFSDETGLNNNFVYLTQMLESRKMDLNLDSYSMDCTSLEQVFLTLCQKADAEQLASSMASTKSVDSSNIELGESGSSTSSTNTYLDEDLSAPPPYNEDAQSQLLMMETAVLKGSCGAQLFALLYKRFLHYKSNLRLMFILLGLPALFVMSAMAFSLIRPPVESEQPILLSPRLYEKHSTEFISPYARDVNDQFVAKVIDKLVMSSSLGNGKTPSKWSPDSRQCQCVGGWSRCESTESSNQANLTDHLMQFHNTEDILNWMVNTEDQYIEARFGGWSMIPSSSEEMKKNISNLMVWYNNGGPHALPSYMNTLSNAVLQVLTGRNNSITTYSHPLELSTKQISRSNILQYVADAGIAALVVVGWALTPCGAALYLVMERTTQQKRLQLLAGVTPLMYWTASLLWDMMIMTLGVMLSAIIYYAFHLPVFVANDNLAAICLITFLFGFSATSLIYLCEKMFTDSSLANMVLYCVGVMVVATGTAILLIIDLLSDSSYTDYCRWVLHKVFLLFPQFAMGDALLEIAKNTIQAIVLSRFNMDTYKTPLGWDSLGYHYVALTLTGIVFFGLNLVIEYQCFIGIFKRKKQIHREREDEDLNVATERYRVELATTRAKNEAGIEAASDINKLHENTLNSYKLQVHTEQRQDGDILQALSLRKVFKSVSGSRVAVDNLTFGVRPGECLGLLGVNGAGKSTTFKMLTGELHPTSGDIKLQGKADLYDGSISYCPQVDSLDPFVTVEQHLNFYCYLRGIVNKSQVVKQTISLFDLSRYRRHRVQELSGGNKRKLCTAIALMSASKLVLMDEPTSGMDAGSRKRVWRLVRLFGGERALVVTSHSVSECEYVCSRVAVLASARLVALESPAALKHKFGGGYLVSVRTSSPTQLPQLSKAVLERFPNTMVQHAQYRTVQFVVPISNSTAKGCTTLAELFSGLEMLSTIYDIQEYAINQSSLDQVFVNFSASLSENYGAKELSPAKLDEQLWDDSLANGDKIVSKL